MMNSFLEAFVHLCMVVTVAIVVVIGCRVHLRRYAGASLAYMSWLLIPVLIVAFLIAKIVPATPIELPMPSAIKAPPILTSSVRSVTQTGLDAVQVLLAIWLIGMCVVAVWFAMRQYRFVQSLGWLTSDQPTCTAIPVLRAAFTSAGPIVFGLFKPRIVIPADFYERYSHEERRLVIAHELAHVRRGDIYTNTFAVFLQIIFWFNPLVHWAASRMRFDQELACDALVLRSVSHRLDQTKTYVSAVLKAALPANGAPLACHWQFRHPLNERIISMTALKPREISRRLAQIGLTVVALASCYAVLAFSGQTPNAGVGQYRIDLDYTEIGTTEPVSADRSPKTYSLTLDADSLRSIVVGTNDACHFIFSIRPVEQDQVTMPFSLNCNKEGNSSSRLSTRLGARSTIRREVEQSNGKRVSHTLSFVVTAPSQ
jgi:beta-lactamase regulating signal transducer with metallopeptidase domain